MIYGSLFSGMGGIDLACDRAGMSCAWQCEKDPQCRNVLAKHWPDVPKFDDVVKLRAMMERKNAKRVASQPVRPELIVGGFPCQDLSVAGQRAGLAGGRSGLWFVFRRIVAIQRPRWVLIENVPGLLSSSGWRDMGTILWALGNLGYGYAYRVLDAQWCGVPQRRRRVFIVGCFGDVRGAAEVLFERDCLPWDSAPSRKAGARIAASVTAGSATGSGVNRPGRRREDDVNLAVFGGNNTTGEIEVATACNAHGGTGRHDFESETFVSHTLRAEGHDASEDGTGRGTPIIPIDMRQAGRGETMTNNRREGTSGGAPGTGNGDPGCVAFQTRIARNGRGQPKEFVDALTSCDGGTHDASNPHVTSQFGVRRLLPIECLRLQGMPDDWLDDLGLSDSAKYRMIGNGVAEPCVEWITKRIAARSRVRAADNSDKQGDNKANEL